MSVLITNLPSPVQNSAHDVDGAAEGPEAGTRDQFIDGLKNGRLDAAELLRSPRFDEEFTRWTLEGPDRAPQDYGLEPGVYANVPRPGEGAREGAQGGGLSPEALQEAQQAGLLTEVFHSDGTPLLNAEGDPVTFISRSALDQQMQANPDGALASWFAETRDAEIPRGIQDQLPFLWQYRSLPQSLSSVVDRFERSGSSAGPALAAAAPVSQADIARGPLFGLRRV
ncbi:MAG: hypothetical protein AAFQ82_17690 [Myxococcota bacterium]